MASELTDTPVLSTDRFLLRPLQAGDENALYSAMSNDDLMRYWSRAPFTDAAEFRSYLFDREWDGRTWIAVPRAGGDPVCRVVASAHGKEVCEIGYIIVPGNERRGVAKECVSALITHLFRAEGVHRIFADVDPRNVPSNRLLQSLGFTREAHLRHAMRTHIGWCDTWLWGLLEDEWPL